MIHIKDLAHKVQKYLESNNYHDFKIFIRISFSIDVYVFTDDNITNECIKKRFIDYLRADDDAFYSMSNFFRISFTIIPTEDKEDPFYANILNSDEKIIIGPRYRLDSILSTNTKSTNKPPTPIITFYSYKGGMGRTTTMIAYAIDIAMHKNQKVVIIDCDLEAPGYLNFFNLSNNEELKNGKKNGLVEFMGDLQMLNEEGKQKLELNDYIINIGDTADVNDPAFESFKNIWLIPAGNINVDYLKDDKKDEENLSDYLEGLSKLNISNTKEVVNNFSILFEKIKETIDPDVILLDSRTGFNDIFGTAAFYLSSCVIGFFGFSRQTQPGLINLINNYYLNEDSFKLMLVFSILPNESDSMTFETELYSEVNTMVNRKCPNESSNKRIPVCNSLHRNHCLEQIGIGKEQNDNAFIQLVKERKFTDFNEIFYDINEMWKPSLNRIDKPFEDANNTVGNNDNTNIEQTYYTQHQDIPANASALALRNIILRHLKSEFSRIKMFAETTAIEESSFFYRKCMQDFFKVDKFIINGYKGTGKTYLYRALSNHQIAANIQKWANVEESSEITFIQILPETDGVSGAFPFESFEYKSIEEPEYYFNCFWQIYTWNTILCDNRFSDIRKESKLYSFAKPIEGYEVVSRFNELIGKGIETLITIEEDLHKVNTQLVRSNKKIFVLYDRLDNCINPLHWNKAVSPLIEYWRNNYKKYSNISPKIFIRTDLFKQIGGTNTERLKENQINIEWSIGEVFGYFFKLIFSDPKASQAYWKIADEKVGTPKDYIKNTKAAFSSDFPLNQFKNCNRAELSPLVEIFFGRKVIIGTSMLGHPWEYFEKDLANADNNSISLRPFINRLDGNAVDKALAVSNRYVKEIISPSIYASKEVRDKATDSYFEDLTRDRFSKDLENLRTFIRSNKGECFRYKSLREEQYANLLNEVFAMIQDSSVVKTIKDLDNLISANGIMARKPTNHGTYYVFAPIYFYSWGLKDGDLEKENKPRFQGNKTKYKPSPKEGMEYHGKIKQENYKYYAIPNEELHPDRFEIENKPFDVADGERVTFTVFPSPKYNGKGIYWKARINDTES